MKRISINSKALFNSTQFGFSQIVISHPGKYVFISGQVAWDEHQHIIGENDLAIQTQKVIDNLKIAIESARGTLKDIMMLRIYKVNYQEENGSIISSVLKKNFGIENPPASTWINVSGLANRNFLIEIEAQAIL